MAARALAADVSIGKEMSGLGVVELLGGLLYKLAGIVHCAEIIRRELMMCRRSGPGVDIERYTELREGTLDQLMVAIDDLLGGDTFFSRADGHRHAVFITTADKERLFTFQTQISGVDIRRNVHSGEVSNMHGSVRIRECSCD